MQRVHSWDNVRMLLLMLFAPTENSHRVFDLGEGVDSRLLLCPACGCPMPVALPGPWGRALSPMLSTAHMWSTCLAAASSTPCPKQITVHGRPSAAHSHHRSGCKRPARGCLCGGRQKLKQESLKQLFQHKQDGQLRPETQTPYPSPRQLLTALIQAAGATAPLPLQKLSCHPTPCQAPGFSCYPLKTWASYGASASPRCLASSKATPWPGVGRAKLLVSNTPLAPGSESPCKTRSRAERLCECSFHALA